MNTIDLSFTEEIYSVSRLNREVRFLLEGSFPSIWVEGEISNFVCPSSGHWYFSLKDSTAQIRCAMFKQNNRRTQLIPKDGTLVLIKARISLYEGRGDFQLIVEHIEEAGEGKLRQEFEALKKRLLEAGLFKEENKKPLPLLPKTIGVITSATGAAIRDILSVLRRRFTSSAVIIYPTLVQGELAAPNIVKAIQIANRRAECDVLILSRGGGSIEDLWPFNDEKVAYAIFESALPIVSGVGHEIDFTIADFVADVRAPTPSAAAELVVPDQADLQKKLDDHTKKLFRLIKQVCQQLGQQIVWVNKQLQGQHPKRKLLEQSQQLDLYETSLVRLIFKLMTSLQSKSSTLQARLFGLTPHHQIKSIQQLLNHHHMSLKVNMTNQLQTYQQKLTNCAAQLDTLSPLATLNRGYAIAIDNKNKVLRHVHDICIDDQIQVRLAKGSLYCSISAIKPE